jgi:ring-1,2-phenylacetyl-CoA epoxidase subunit PaaD
MTSVRPSASQDDIWGWLDLVPDPEIPVISVVDLGIVRDVDVGGRHAGRHGHAHLFRLPRDGGDQHGDREMRSGRAASRSLRLRDASSRRPGRPIGSCEKGRARLEEYGIAPPNPAGGPAIAAPAAARPTSNGSASSDPPPARRNGAAATAWNPSTISSASEVTPVPDFIDLTVTGIEKTIRDAVVVTLRPPEDPDAFTFRPRPIPDLPP